MRWTQNDTAAFNTMMKAGQAIRDTYDQYQAGKAYREGAGLGAVDASEYDKYADQFAETNPEASAAYRQAAEGVRQGLVSVPTQQERRARGITSQAEYYYGRGDYDKAGDLESRALQMQAAQDQLARGRRQDKREADNDAALELYRSRVKDPASYLMEAFNNDIIGGEKYKGYKVEAADTNGGKMVWLVGPDGNAVLDERGSPKAMHLTNDQIEERAFSEFMRTTNPAEFAKFQRGVKKDEAEAAYRQGLLRNSDRQLDITDRHYRAMENISAANANRERFGLQPLQGGYSFNPNNGGFFDPSGKRVTDPVMLEKLTKIGTPSAGGQKMPQMTVAEARELRDTVLGSIATRSKADPNFAKLAASDPDTAYAMERDNVLEQLGFGSVRGLGKAQGATGGLDLSPPKLPQTAAPMARAEAPARGLGGSEEEFNVMLRDAARGGARGLEYLAPYINGEFPTSPGQRAKMRELGIIR